MKMNKWTVALAAAGWVSLPSPARAEEKASALQAALEGVTISGYVDTSAQWNFGTGATTDPTKQGNGSALFGPANYPGYLYGGPSKADGFNLNKIKLTIEKPLDEGQWAAGYRADLLFGPDANVFATSSSGVSTADFAIQQAYVSLRAPLGNGLDFKMGVFNSIIGYESHDSVLDPNYTRSYAVGLEPHTHTGLLASYQFSDLFGASAGVANTVGPGINDRATSGSTGNSGTAQGQVFPVAAGTNPHVESFKTYMGSVRFTMPKDWGFIAGSTVDAGVVSGYNRSAGGYGAGLVQSSYYVGGSFNTPLHWLRVGASYDYLSISPQDTLSYTAYANALGGYFSIQASEKFSIHGRGEYLWYSAGTATDAQNGLVPAAEISNVPTRLIACTATLQYDLWKNVLSRLEFRWDHQADGKGRVFGPTSALAGGSITQGSLRNAYLLAANLIYKF